MSEKTKQLFLKKNRARPDTSAFRAASSSASDIFFIFSTCFRTGLELKAGVTGFP
jgi:hypothetical protein